MSIENNHIGAPIHTLFTVEVYEYDIEFWKINSHILNNGRRNTMITETTEDTKNWTDLAISLYERLTDRGAEIVYDFRNMEVQVPSKVGQAAEHTMWKVNGVLIIRTCESNTHTNGGGK